MPVVPPSVDDPNLYPYQRHRLVGVDVAEEITGLSITQQKRARLGGLLPFYRHQGRAIRYLMGDLYDYRDAMKVEVARKPITRVRTPEHNLAISNAMKAAAAKKAAKR